MPRPTRSDWLGGLFATVALFAVLHIGTDDAPEAQSAATADAINADMAAMDARIDRAARDLCASELGPGAQVLWTHQGDLVCRPAVITAGGAQ